MIHTTTVFKLMRGTVCVDSTTTDQWLSPDVALEKAREIRDKLNRGTTNPILQPVRIVRTFRQRRVNQL